MSRISRPDRAKPASSKPAGRESANPPAAARPDRDDAPARESTPERRDSTDRRNRSWRTILYGNFRPRRRESRREADQHHYLFDWHEPRVLYLALGVLLLSCTDALFTLNLINIGATEANVFMASMLADGVDRFVVSKIWITSLSVVVLVVVARRRLVGPINVEHLLQFFCAMYSFVILYEIYLFAYVFELKIF